MGGGTVVVDFRAFFVDYLVVWDDELLKLAALLSLFLGLLWRDIHINSMLKISLKALTLSLYSISESKSYSIRSESFSNGSLGLMIVLSSSKIWQKRVNVSWMSIWISLGVILDVKSTYCTASLKDRESRS